MSRMVPLLTDAEQAQLDAVEDRLENDADFNDCDFEHHRCVEIVQEVCEIEIRENSLGCAHARQNFGSERKANPILENSIKALTYLQLLTRSEARFLLIILRIKNNELRSIDQSYDDIFATRYSDRNEQSYIIYQKNIVRIALLKRIKWFNSMQAAVRGKMIQLVAMSEAPIKLQKSSG